MMTCGCCGTYKRHIKRKKPFFYLLVWTPVMMNMLLEAGRARLFDLIAARPPLHDKRKTAVYYNNPSTKELELFSLIQPRCRQDGQSCVTLTAGYPKIRRWEKLAFYIPPLLTPIPPVMDSRVSFSLSFLFLGIYYISGREERPAKKERATGQYSGSYFFLFLK